MLAKYIRRYIAHLVYIFNSIETHGALNIDVSLIALQKKWGIRDDASIVDCCISCQGLAGPWYARRERGAVRTRVSDSMV